MYESGLDGKKVGSLLVELPKPSAFNRSFDLQVLEGYLRLVSCSERLCWHTLSDIYRTCLRLSLGCAHSEVRIATCASEESHLTWSWQTNKW
jgi:hypothetical protein